MKKFKLLLSSLLLGCMLGLTGQAPRLIFTEWAHVPNKEAQYFELTNMEDTAINLRDFTVAHYFTGWQAESHIALNLKDWVLPFRNFFVGADSMLGPKESIVVAPKSERVSSTTGFTDDREPLLEIADLWVYVIDAGLDVGVIDSVTHGYIFRPQENEPKYLFYILPDGDSIAVDAYNNMVNPATGAFTGPSSIAGIERANRQHIMVRKANINSGNLNWDLARGTDLTDSEWMPIPYDWWNNNWNPSLFTTIGTHGDFSIVFDSETLTIDHNSKTITVPWGYRKGTVVTIGTHSRGIIEEIDFGPGMSYWYQEYADSSTSVCQNGDMLDVYACGNSLKKATYTIIAGPAADDNALVLPKRTFNHARMTWSFGGGGDSPAMLLEPYTVSEGVPGMDTISRIMFAERTDTLMAYLEIAPGASSEFVFVDGKERVDLKYGDILRITAKDGTTKDYFLALEELMKGDNANLASITWPDLPFEMHGWKGDTIPGFSPGVTLYSFTVPYGMNNIPALAVSKEDYNAFVKIQRATDIDGSQQQRTTTITVTSQDSSRVKVYNVIFVKERLEEDIQPYKAEPIITEWNNPRNRSWFVEIANVGNQDIDLSEYVFVTSTADNPAVALTNWITTDSTSSYAFRWNKYIPGYKYGSYGEWQDKPATVKLDPDIDPILPPGECFVMAGLESWFFDPNNILYTDPSKINIHWSDTEPNIHGELVPRNGVYAFPRTYSGHTMYIFKIHPDSAAAIYNGSKGITDPGDFILIDRLGGQSGVKWVVAGNEVNNNEALRRKPSAYLPNPNPFGGFGTNAEDSDWIFDKWSLNPAPIGNFDKIKAMMYDIDNYTHDPITHYMSYVSSLAYLVDPGYKGNLEIEGVLANTSLITFESNIIKMNDDQVLKVLSKSTAGDTLQANDIIAQGDTLLVISADGMNMTKYILNVGSLDDNAVLVAKEGSGYVVDITGETATIAGIVFESTLNEILANLEKPALALLNVLDADNNLIPLKVLNLSDSTYKETIFTGGVFFEVVAQDKSKITYELIETVASSDAWLSSNSYTVNQLNKVIYDVPLGTSAEIFMSMLYTAGGATMELFDKAGFSRDIGYISLDDYVRVTSEDGSTVVDYTLRFIGFILSGEAFVTSDVYVVNTDEASIGSVPANTDVSVFLANVTPASGAIMILKDEAGAEKESGEMLTGDVLTVTSEDGLNTVSYTVNVLVSTELNVLESVKVYPNPVNNILNITGLKKQTRVELISITGQVLRSELTSDQSYVMDMSSQKSGYYILRITDNDQNATLFRIVCAR